MFFAGDFDQPMKEADAGEFLLPLQMVRLAPSAVNKQPWRLVVAGDVIHFYKMMGKGFSSAEAGDMQKIDMGIALCHFTLGAEEAGMRVEMALEDPGVSVPDKIEYIASLKVSD